ncbi:MAG: hypothetical protein JW986_10230 [Methanotrichaceae archaeon]|nr:hypothetical protein [Methanotrichaceae archaeon]
MRLEKILAAMLMLIASTVSMAGASSPLSSGLDIIGSKADIIEVVSPGGWMGEIDIVGSELDDIRIITPGWDGMELVGSSAGNITISSSAPEVVCQPADITVICQGCPPAVGGSAPLPHLGVDAWYGQYWYASNPYAPRWPQI